MSLYQSFQTSASQATIKEYYLIQREGPEGCCSKCDHHHADTDSTIPPRAQAFYEAYFTGECLALLSKLTPMSSYIENRSTHALSESKRCSLHKSGIPT